MDAEVKCLEAVESRLRSEILAIVTRYKTHGKPLTWRAMFDIEDEAISLLESEPGLDLRYINLMASPSAQRPRAGGEPGRSELHAMHTVLWMIQEAYYRKQ